MYRLTKRLGGSRPLILESSTLFELAGQISKIEKETGYDLSIDQKTDENGCTLEKCELLSEKDLVSMRAWITVQKEKQKIVEETK
jgi:hypothetical protein